MTTRKHKKRKRKFKPRFFMLCAVLLVIIIGVAYYVFGSPNEKPINAKDLKKPQNTTQQAAAKSEKESATKIEGTKDPDLVKNTDKAADELKATVTDYNTQVYNAILNSKYTAIVSKTKNDVMKTYGEVTTNEEWGGGMIYVHKSFPQSMYVGYNEKEVCDFMEIPLSRVKNDVTSFTVDTKVFGKLKVDNSDEMESPYYYQIDLNDRYITVFASEDGTVSMGSNMLVKLK